MKVLSVQQPWASLIAAGIKDVENRTWKPREIPDRILIHASKKCSLRTISNEPIEWIQEMLNEQMMGNLPDFPDMPSNAIIGYFSIDRIDQKVDGSIWASGGDDMEWLYYWHINDCYLFDEPILDVKGKLHLWEYEMEENNMPPSHKVELRQYQDRGDELFIPVNDKRWEKLGENQALNFDLGYFCIKRDVPSAELQGMAAHLMALQRKLMQRTQRTLPRQSQKRLQTCPPNHKLLTHLPMLTLLLNPEN